MIGDEERPRLQDSLDDLARLIRSLPHNHPDRAFYEQEWRETKALQTAARKEWKEICDRIERKNKYRKKE